MTATVWWVLALLLAILELLSGTFFALMLALAAAVTALASHAGLTDWMRQAGLFAVLALALCACWYRRRPAMLRRAENALNRGAGRWIGRTITLSEGLSGGEGRVSVDDSFWRVRGPDCAAGATVRIVAVEGNVLVVEPV
ncbi:MAG: NfeD family protein [Perlucidibaca sp.]